MNNESIVNNDIFECKMYITDLETNKDSKEIDVSDLVFKDWIEFEFGNYEDDDYGTLPYKDFKFFINDYSVTFYSPQYHKTIQEIDRLNNIINELEKILQNEWIYYDQIVFNTHAEFDDEEQVNRFWKEYGAKLMLKNIQDKLKELKENNK